MKLFHSPLSPFVRKVLVVAHELGIAGSIELLPSAAHPVNRDSTIMPHNPLGQVPTMILDDGTALYDSSVICDYLDAAYGKGRIVPAAGVARWRALREQATADGLVDAALLARYEAARPADRKWQPWSDGQLGKIRSCLAAIEAGANEFGDRFDIGTISIACALGYLDLRFADMNWRASCPEAARWFERIAKRPSVAATSPTG